MSELPVGTDRELAGRMTIVCGTDFSDSAKRAVEVAALLAARSRTSLHLVHAAHSTGSEESALSQHVAFTHQLDRVAEHARSLGATVRTEVEKGSPEEALQRVAKREGAELIVVGALGSRAPGVSQLGSHAERLAQDADVPVLVVRDESPFQAWLTTKRPLRVTLGADFSHSTDAAFRWVSQWRELSPCMLTAVHLYWPPQEFARLGLHGVRSFLEPDPEVTRALTRDLKRRFAPKDDPESLEIHVEPHLGRLGDRLADLASLREADLLVVGSRPRGVLGRIREGSVSHWALHAARTSVLVVPAARDADDRFVPRMRNVVVATDFSRGGNAAVNLGYALAEPGGTVHLIHVVPQKYGSPLEAHDIFDLERSGDADDRRTSAHSALARLVPQDAAHRATRYYALESNEPALAICQAAARLDADAICVGRRGRSELAEALLGSTSRQVVTNAQCPVLLAQAPRT